MAGDVQGAPIGGARVIPAVPPPERPSSVRQELACAALGAALAVDAVGDGHPGPSRTALTRVGSELLSGVRVAAGADGGGAPLPERYSIDLHLTAHPVPLYALADQVRARVARAAGAAGLGAALGPVNITFEDLAEDVAP